MPVFVVSTRRQIPVIRVTVDVLYKLIGQTKVCAPPNWFVTNVNRPIADLCVKLNC